MLVDREAGGLHDKDVHAADVFEQLEVNLAVGEALQLGLSDGHANVLADLARELRVGRAAEELEALVFAERTDTLAFGGRLGR
jgi:hypothetical protein